MKFANDNATYAFSSIRDGGFVFKWIWQLIQKHQIFDHAKKTTLDRNMILFGDHLKKEEKETFEAWENDNRKKDKWNHSPEVG